MMYQNLLEQYYQEDDEEKLQSIKLKLLKKYGTNRICIKCGKQLLKSDLKAYKYLCLNCDENFYEFETAESDKV